MYKRLSGKNVEPTIEGSHMGDAKTMSKIRAGMII